MNDGNGPANVCDRVQLDGRADARSRVREFTDPGSFTEFGSRARHRTHAFGMQHKRPAGDGVVTGIGRSLGPGAAAQPRTRPLRRRGGVLAGADRHRDHAA
ncbi:MAG: carboxyl transferase domain-containing protein [Pseudonocardiaceae bacterium]